MNAFERLERLEQRIAELRAGVEVDAKHINVLLSPAQQCEFDMEWQRQQTLRKAKKPATVLVKIRISHFLRLLCEDQSRFRPALTCGRTPSNLFSAQGVLKIG